jgi:MFS-type transporter involved in bile tolerance (Atg22 family)
LSVLYYNAYLPLLVASTPEVRLSAGSAEYDDVRNAETNRLSNRGYAWGYVGGVLLLMINVGVAFGFSPACMQWCDDCPADWAPWEYNIDNDTLVTAGFASYLDPFGTSYAWPGVNPPCDTDLDVDAGRCLARAAYRCDATGCVNISALGACVPDDRNRCDEDDLLSKSREDEYCTDSDCPTFRCARRDCGRNFDAGSCDPAAWNLRINLLLGGLWWLGFGVLSIRRLEARPRPPLPPGKSHLREGVRRIATTIRKARQLPNVFRFLIAYWLYSDGLQALMTGAVLIASQPPVSMTALDLGILVLMTNFMGIFSVMGFDWFSRRLSAWYITSERGKDQQLGDGRIPTTWISKYILIGNLCGILLLPVLGMVTLRTKTEFYLVAAFMYSTNMASMQSFSRSLVSSFTPRGLEGEFSSFMQLTDRGTSFLSPLLLAIIADQTGSVRTSLFFISILIVIGIIIFTTVDTEEAIREATNFSAHDADDDTLAATPLVSTRESKSKRGSRVSSRSSAAPSSSSSHIEPKEEVDEELDLEEC